MSRTLITFLTSLVKPYKNYSLIQISYSLFHSLSWWRLIPVFTPFSIISWSLKYNCQSYVKKLGLWYSLHPTAGSGFNSVMVSVYELPKWNCLNHCNLFLQHPPSVFSFTLLILRTLLEAQLHIFCRFHILFL